MCLDSCSENISKYAFNIEVKWREVNSWWKFSFHFLHSFRIQKQLSDNFLHFIFNFVNKIHSVSLLLLLLLYLLNMLRREKKILIKCKGNSSLWVAVNGVRSSLSLFLFYVNCEMSCLWRAFQFLTPFFAALMPSLYFIFYFFLHLANELKKI